MTESMPVGDGERVRMRLNEARGSDGGSKALLIPSLTPFSGYLPAFSPASTRLSLGYTLR